jgi:hypothetical protein
MAARGLVVVCSVRPFATELTVNVAREVPVKVDAGPRNCRVRRLGDKPEASLINLLEHKRSVISAETPTRIFKRIRSAVEHGKSLGVEELGEIVVIAMDYDGAFADEGIADAPAMETIGGLPTNGLGESESEETDSSHEQQDKADKPHLLSPRSLSFGIPEALEKS